MAAGEKEQLKLLGIPAHEREIGLSNVPDCEVAVTVKLPVRPPRIVMVDGEAAKVTVAVVGGGGVVAIHAELYLIAPLI